MLLNYGSHSTELREAFALSTRRLANSIVEWKELRAMSAKREIALSKIKGFRPIGIGECSTRIQGKTINLITNRYTTVSCFDIPSRALAREGISKQRTVVYRCYPIGSRGITEFFDISPCFFEK